MRKEGRYRPIAFMIRKRGAARHGRAVDDLVWEFRADHRYRLCRSLVKERRTEAIARSTCFVVDRSSPDVVPRIAAYLVLYDSGRDILRKGRNSKRNPDDDLSIVRDSESSAIGMIFSASRQSRWSVCRCGLIRAPTLPVSRVVCVVNYSLLLHIASTSRSLI